MKDKVFIDTNIWVYAKISGKEIDKHNMSKSFLSEIRDKIIISTQVINEFYNVLLKNNIDDETIIKSINSLLNGVRLVDITFKTIEKSWEIRKRYKYSLFDSIILASALESNCSTLYTEDMQHNQLIEGQLRIINPFRN